MGTPVLAALKRHFPAAKLTAMCQGSVLHLLTHDPHLDALIGFKRPTRWIHRQQRRDILAPLRKEQFDLGILLTNSFSSAWYFWRGGVSRRIGFAGNLRTFLLTDSVPTPENIERQHLVHTYQMLLEPLGIAPSHEAPRLYILDEELQSARELLQRCGWDPATQILVGMNPGAAYGTAKCWLPERFKALTERLVRDSRFFVVYFGDSITAPVVQSICADIPGDRLLNLATKTSLRELMALIATCQLFLTNDSGPMHIAAALKTPLLALFGSTSDVKTGPYGEGPCRVIHKYVSCSPCYQRVCPIDFRCMKAIEVDEVYNALLALCPQR